MAPSTVGTGEGPHNMSGTGRLSDSNPARVNEKDLKEPMPYPQFPGVWIHDAKSLNSKQKNKVAAYLGITTIDEWLALYSDPAVKALVEDFYYKQKLNFNLERDKEPEKWKPTTGVMNKWRLCLEKLRSPTKKDWMATIAKGEAQEMLPLRIQEGEEEGNYPPGFEIVAPDSYDEAYAWNIIAYCLKLWYLNRYKIAKLWCPVECRYGVMMAESWYRYWVVLRSYDPEKTLKRTPIKIMKNIWRPLPGSGTGVIQPAKKGQIKSFSAEELSLDAGSDEKFVDIPCLFDEYPVFLKYPAFDAKDMYGSGSDKARILEDQSERPVMTEDELSELHTWLVARTTVMGKGSSLNESRAGATEEEADESRRLRRVFERDMVIDLSEQFDDKDSDAGTETEEDSGVRTKDNPGIAGLLSEVHKQHMFDYVQSCAMLGLSPEDPKAFPEDVDFTLKPHQVTGIAMGYQRERDAFPFHILADDCGLGKACQVLHIIHYINIRTKMDNEKLPASKRTPYRPTVILAPQAVCTNWVDDAARMFPPLPEGLRVVTFYSKTISVHANNFTDIKSLEKTLKNLDPANPETGRFVIVSTPQTFCNATTQIDEKRREVRQNAAKIPRKERATNFDPEDFDLTWDIALERIVVDEAHVAKNPTTRTNSTLCKFHECRNFWYISATPLDNSAEDIFGVTKLMKGFLERAPIGIIAAIEKRKAGSKITAKTYTEANSRWKMNIKDAKETRIFLNHRATNPKPWYNPDGETIAEKHALELLHHDVVHTLLTDKQILDGSRIPPSVAKDVIGFIIRMTTIRRTKFTEEQVPREGTTAEDEDFVAISPADEMKPCEVSTVDLLPGLSEHNWYQKNIAPLHSLRIYHKKKEELLAYGKESGIDAAVDRVIQVATSHKYFGIDPFKTAVSRKVREDRQRTAFTEEQIQTAKWDRHSISMPRYPLPFEAKDTDDRFATYWYTKMSNDMEVIVPSARIDILKRLLIDSTKFRYVTIELLKAKRTKERMIIFVAYPIQQLFLESIAGLLSIPIISMRAADSTKLRGEKTAIFNDPQSDVLAFVVMSSVGAHGINLHQACTYMIQMDIATNAYQMMQMKGRIDRLGQKYPTRVEILALDYTFDVQRQANIANKMIPTLAALSEHNENAEVTGDLSKIGEETVRVMLGQTCSRAEWAVADSIYMHNFSDGRDDKLLTDAHNKFLDQVAAYSATERRFNSAKDWFRGGMMALFVQREKKRKENRAAGIFTDENENAKTDGSATLPPTPVPTQENTMASSPSVLPDARKSLSSSHKANPASKKRAKALPRDSDEEDQGDPLIYWNLASLSLSARKIGQDKDEIGIVKSKKPLSKTTSKSKPDKVRESRNSPQSSSSFRTPPVEITPEPELPKSRVAKRRLPDSDDEAEVTPKKQPKVTKSRAARPRLPDSDDEVEVTLKKQPKAAQSCAAKPRLPDSDDEVEVTPQKRPAKTYKSSQYIDQSDGETEDAADKEPELIEHVDKGKGIDDDGLEAELDGISDAEMADEAEPAEMSKGDDENDDENNEVEDDGLDDQFDY